MCGSFATKGEAQLLEEVDPKRFEFTNFVCVALVSFVRDDILGGDFACCMENLQGSAAKVKQVKDLLNKANDVCFSYCRHEQNYEGTDYY